jgi:cytoplasmic iron level regulating protein YaaA (DUF328/UPF0246 family)
MFLLLSPAKRLDFETPPITAVFSQCEHLAEAGQLAARMRAFSPVDLANLMHLSDRLATLNVTRYHDWSVPFSPANARQAVLAFAGDVYDGLSVTSLVPATLEWAQSQLGILSGLYGLLRPLDLIQPYRLEMGTRLKTERGEDLYAFWGNILRDAVWRAVDASNGEKALINLASTEYFKVVRAESLGIPIVQPVFLDWTRNGQQRVLGLYAKRARGLMARFILENRIDTIEPLKSFDAEGYTFDATASKPGQFVFTR